MKKERQYGEEWLLRGQAAVFAASSQLCLHGHTPSFPSVDVGYDIIIGNGLRLQVKAATLKQNNLGMKEINRNFGYSFDLRRGAWLAHKQVYWKSKLRPYSEVADFFVLWGVEENRFFILPTNHKRQRIWFSSRNSVSLSNNRKLFDKLTEDRRREFEDRWDLLDIDNTTNALIESVSTEIQPAQKEN